MFRIRRIHDSVMPGDRKTIAAVQDILRAQFDELDPAEIEALPRLLHDPMARRYRTLLLCAEKGPGQVAAFATLCHFPDLDFSWLDFMSVAPGGHGRGLGGALFERVRDEAAAVGATHLLFECLPDDPALCRDKSLLPQNAARLRFYERYGARAVTGTAYETPLSPDHDCPPHLMVDSLGTGAPLSASRAAKMVRAVLTRKYGHKCPPGYVEAVAASFTASPVALAPPRIESEPAAKVLPGIPEDARIGLFVNQGHEIHHVHERGYVEAPVRISRILAALDTTGLFEKLPVRHFGKDRLTRVHDPDFVAYLLRVCASLPADAALYPYVFPLRNRARPPREMARRAGYYCIDTFTPLSANAAKAARGAVDCALSAADEILRGRRLAYALVRPPGHHAQRRAFGGFCYFNSAALAADLLAAEGPVALLDIDYHHGNGSQDIFYERGDVLTLSIHGHPSFAYPYFSGFADELGTGPGRGANRNLPLAEHAEPSAWFAALDKALAQVRAFAPLALVVSLGLDTAKADPTGTWSLSARDFTAAGAMIGSLGLPVLVVQEGGYRVRSIGTNCRNFFQGLFNSARRAAS